MTQIQFIRNLFWKNPAPELSCQQVTELVRVEFSITSKYLSGSVSSTLRKLVDRHCLFVVHDKTGPKGGKVYKRILV